MAELVAPIAGKVLEVKIAVGDEVREDQEILVVEALKMRMPVYADRAGRVTEIRVGPGDIVAQNQVLAVVA